VLANFGQWFHLFFAFSFVATLMLWDWNGRAARATSIWSERALLFRVIQTAGRTAGLGSLGFLGVFGHRSAVARGYRMSVEPWLWWVTGRWRA
jgi:hypothetical protein